MTGDSKQKRSRDYSQASGSHKLKKRARHIPQPGRMNRADDVEIRIRAIAHENWARLSEPPHSKDPSGLHLESSVVSEVYREFLSSEAVEQSLATLVETKYFESFLWPLCCNYVGKGADLGEDQHHDIVNSVMAMIVYARKRDGDVLHRIMQCFEEDKEAFTGICRSLFQESAEVSSCSSRQLCFLTELFRMLDHKCVRDALEPLVGMPVWVHLSPRALREQAETFLSFRKRIKRIAKRAQKRNNTSTSLEEDGLFRLQQALESQISVFAKAPSDAALQHAITLLTFFAELLSHPSTLIFVRPLLEDRLTLPRVQGLTSMLTEKHRIFSSALWATWMSEFHWFAYFMTFPHDVATGEIIPRDIIRDKQSQQLVSLQSAVYALSRKKQLPPHYPITFIPLSPQGSLRKQGVLKSAFLECGDNILDGVRDSLDLGILHKPKQTASASDFSKEDAEDNSSRLLFINTVANFCSTPPDALELFRKTSLMIHEKDIQYITRRETTFLESTRMPWLNTEFLNMQEYLLRNFNTYKFREAMAVREHLDVVLRKMQPFWNGTKHEFTGQSDFALPIATSDHITPEEVLPGSLSAMGSKLQLLVNLRGTSFRTREIWDNAVRHSAMFLVKFTSSSGQQGKGTSPPSADAPAALMSQVKVRGIATESGKAQGKRKQNIASEERIISGLVDQFQLKLDSQEAQSDGDINLYDFDLLVRTSYRKDTFLPLLSTLRETLLDEGPCVPLWLEDILVGREAKVDQQSDVFSEDSIDFGDTFISESHLKASFPDADVSIVDSGGKTSVGRSFFHLQFSKKDSRLKVKAEGYTPERARLNFFFGIGKNRNESKMNSISFDPNQVHAIHCGMKQGLTLVAGPPGTGKTSCVVQLATNLFHSTANETVLIITRSDSALDEVVERIISTQVDPLRVLKLVESRLPYQDESTSLQGRVNALLQRRWHLLSEVTRLASFCNANSNSLPLQDWNCELAENFYQTVVRAKWQAFMESSDQSWKNFPFKGFFLRDPEADRGMEFGKIEDGKEKTQDPLICYSQIASLFANVDEMRFLEVLRQEEQRSSYVLTTYSRIVAMTFRYAAAHRKELLAKGFSYDTVIVEEASASHEAETFLSMVLQVRSVFGRTNRMSRAILVGDQRRVPQVQQEELKKDCNLSQSMFHRLIRRGNKVINLDNQGRSRRSIANSMRCLYPLLKDARSVSSDDRFAKANPGFAYTTQFIDTGDSTSEERIAPDGIQNVVEAEFIAFVFIYMRLLGYPSEQIVVLTMYRSQVVLLQRTIESRLAEFPKVNGSCYTTTIDEYEGREAEFVLVSLVRTATTPPPESWDKVLLSISRARLGAYLFGYLPCYKSVPASIALLQKLPSSHRLTLVAAETFTDSARIEDDDLEKSATREVHSAADMALIVSHLYSAISANP